MSIKKSGGDLTTIGLSNYAVSTFDSALCFNLKWSEIKKKHKAMNQ